MLDLFAIFADPFYGQLARPGDPEIGRLILVAESVTTNNDRIGPTRDQARDILDDDRLAEDDATKDVADRTVRRLPHLLEAEFLDPSLVRSDRRAFDADAVLPDCFRGFDRDPIVGLVALFHTKVEIKQFDIEIGQDEPLADPLPDDAGHFVTVELDDRVLHLDSCHKGLLRFLSSWICFRRAV